MLDPVRVARAIATNQIARFAPSVYLQMTAQTGRGDSSTESAVEIAQYFKASVADYLARVGLSPVDAPGYFGGKTIIEYGPGDFPGVAVLLAAYGAAKVYCVDRFAMVNLGEKNLQVLEALAKDLDEPARSRLAELRTGAVGGQQPFAPDKIEYVVKPSGLSGLRKQADLVISRAVLEHVDDLQRTFEDMLHAMRPGATALHLVDLKSHGLHTRNALDFLECAPWLWSLMYSHKGVPNRWRINRYRDIVAALHVTHVEFEVTTRTDPSLADEVRPRLSYAFRDVSSADLQCLGFWLRFDKKRE
ncbi:MAG: methyltransferase domain-containing protein [Burkholderiaceae bacterium]